MTFIFNLDVEDFLGLVRKAFEVENKKREEKQDEFILHRWGYELPYMEKRMQLFEYRKLVFGEKPSGNKKKIAIEKHDNKELIDKINKLKEVDQKRKKLNN